MIDYSGREMRISDVGKHNSDYEPTLDHIRPLSQGGVDELDNLIICNRLTNFEKGESFSTWKTNGKRFQARRERGKKNKYTIGGIEEL